jgi:hypothetical protein
MEYGDMTIQDQAGILPASAVGFFTRDMTLAAGTQAITGVGFLPNSIIFFANVQTTTYISLGMDNDGRAANVAKNSLGVNWEGGGGAAWTETIHLSSGSGTHYYGYIATFDSDGFTVQWTKSGAPTGTARMQYMAFK